jgi:hypothetical protein
VVEGIKHNNPVFEGFCGCGGPGLEISLLAKLPK